MENTTESISNLVAKHKAKAKQKEEEDIRKKNKNLQLSKPSDSNIKESSEVPGE